MRSIDPGRPLAPRRTRLAAAVSLGIVVLAALLATALPLASEVSVAIVTAGWLAVIASRVLELAATAYSLHTDAVIDRSQAEASLRTEVATVSDELGVSRPVVSVLDRPDPTAMVIALPGVSRLYVTTALLETAGPVERRALIGHELGHVNRYDGLTQTLVGAVANAVGLAVFWWWALAPFSIQTQLGGVVGFQLLYLARSIRPAGLAVAVLGGLTSLVVSLALVQFAQYQEYRADAIAAAVVGDPRPVVRALATLDVHQQTAVAIDRSHWETTGDGETLVDRLVAHHPPRTDRVDALLAEPVADEI